ncbi:MAG: hypothetical protein ABR577_12380 [Pyrinomonadaceae bacterium]
MNIHIILDKALFQSISAEAFTPLDRHFEIIIPPILFKEIWGDLATEKKEDPRRWVAYLASRLGANYIICPDYVDLLCNSLLGNEPPMDGRLIAAGMRPVKSSGGSLGYFVDPTPEDEALQRWQKQQVSFEESLWAYRWQRIRRYINTNLYLRKLSEAGVSVQKPKDLSHLQEIIDFILANPKTQGRLLNLLFRESEIPLQIQRRAIIRWFKSKRPLLSLFAPYAAHCVKANLLLALGNMNISILGRQGEHDLRDLEYCYYLPFCEVFALDDRLHRKLIPLLKRPDQRLVGTELRDDLKRLAQEWNAMSQDEKIAHHRKFGNRPAPNSDSITLKLWEKYRPDYNPNKGFMPIKGSNLHEFLLAKCEELKNAQQSEEPRTIEEARFVYQKKLVSREKLKDLYPQADI